MTCFRKAFLTMLVCAVGVSAHAQTSIKFATLAPVGSTWMNVMTEFDKDLQARTGGKLRFKFYAGGVSGDEKDVVSKMRIGQLQAAGVTGLGLGIVAPAVRVMDAPFLFRSAAEVDYVHSKVDAELNAFIEKGGFVNLGWAEVGLVHVFTNTPIRDFTDLKKTKMWVWEGDPIAEAAFKAIDVNPIPLSIQDVMTSLQTGLINAVYSSPMGVVALQWFTKTKYIYSVPLANASGAVLISKKFLDGLPADQRAALLELGAKHMPRLTTLGRAENKQALETLQKQGLTLTHPASPDSLAKYEELARQARLSLVGRLYPAELLEKVESAVGAFRARRQGAGEKPGERKVHH